MRWLVLLAACHAPRPAMPRLSECGEEIPGIEQVAQAPVVLLGEMHGIDGTPRFALDLACRLALRHGQAALALEISRDEQPRIDAFLASNGKDAARSAMLTGEFWTKKMQDGRASQARLAMVERARQLIHAGLRLRLLAVDNGHADRDQHMGEAIVALALNKRGPVIMLVGNNHILNELDEGKLWMGGVVRKQIPETIALDNRYGAGDAWICTLDGDKVVCGHQPLEASDPGLRWSIKRFDKVDEHGVDGTFDVGTPRASDPAVRN